MCENTYDIFYKINNINIKYNIKYNADANIRIFMAFALLKYWRYFYQIIYFI